MLLSLGAAFGLSVLVWQHIFGLDLNWIAPGVRVDHPARCRLRLQPAAGVAIPEENPAGLKTGIIRSMGETGGVVTSAGLVFAFTMMSMTASDLTSIGQAGRRSVSAYCSTP